MLVISKKNAVLDALFGSGATLMPATIYFGLLTAAPNPDGTGVVEASGGSYARVAVTNNTTEWPAAASGAKANANVIQFPTATAGWGTITYFGIFDASSGGNLLAFAALTASRVVLTGDDFRFAAGDLDLAA